MPARVEPDKVFENSLFKMPLEDDINSVRLVSKVLLVSNVGNDVEESFDMCFDSDAASSCF